MKVKSSWYLALFAVLSASVLLTIRPKPVGPVWVTQQELTTEGLGAALMHLRKTIAVTQVLNSCLKVPNVLSTHGYKISSFFHPCPWHPSLGLFNCKVMVFLVEGKLRYSMQHRGFVDLDTLRSCHSVEVLNPELRDYENRYNSTAYLVKNLRRLSEAPLNCDGVDTIFHYRYGDIARNAVQKESKQVHEDAVRMLIGRKIIDERNLLIVTDPLGKQHIAPLFPSARFFTRNDPAALRACAGKAKTFIGGGSTYAYVCFQMINPEAVFTNNRNAKSRVRYPRNITIELPS